MKLSTKPEVIFGRTLRRQHIDAGIDDALGNFLAVQMIIHTALLLTPIFAVIALIYLIYISGNPSGSTARALSAGGFMLLCLLATTGLLIHPANFIAPPEDRNNSEIKVSFRYTIGSFPMECLRGGQPA